MRKVQLTNTPGRKSRGAGNYISQSYRTHGIILRTHKLAEADRIIVVLTADRGQVRAVARGIRRTNSKFGSSLEPFMHTRLQLVPRRNLDVIAQTQTMHPYGALLTNDYDSYGAASAMVETAEQLTREENPRDANTHYNLLHGAIAALTRRAAAPKVLLASYLLRALAVSGWAPTFDTCSKCGVDGQHSWLSVSLGGVLCDDCCPPNTPYATERDVLLLQALLAGDWPEAHAAKESEIYQSLNFVSQYLQYHLEKKLKSLSVLQQM